MPNSKKIFKKKKPLNVVMGETIRQERLKLKCTQQEFSESLGISEVFLSNVENGEKRLSLEKIIKFCDDYHLSLNYFLTGKEFEPLRYSADVFVNNSLIEETTETEQPALPSAKTQADLQKDEMIRLIYQIPPDYLEYISKLLRVSVLELKKIENKQTRASDEPS